LGVGRSGDLLGRDVALGLEPVIGGDYLRGVGGGGEDLGEEVVGVEGDGGYELLKLLGVEGLSLRLTLRLAGIRAGALIGAGLGIRLIGAGLIGYGIGFGRVGCGGVGLAGLGVLILRIGLRLWIGLRLRVLGLGIPLLAVGGLLGRLLGVIRLGLRELALLLPGWLLGAEGGLREG